MHNLKKLMLVRKWSILSQGLSLALAKLRQMKKPSLHTIALRDESGTVLLSHSKERDRRTVPLILTSDDWQKATSDEKINYYSYYQLTLLNQYKNYLTRLDSDSKDHSTFTITELKLDEEDFKNFQTELNNLMMKYYNSKSKETKRDAPNRTIGVTIIPES